jgi:hypothetical protein
MYFFFAIFAGSSPKPKELLLSMVGRGFFTKGNYLATQRPPPTLQVTPANLVSFKR